MHSRNRRKLEPFNNFITAVTCTHYKKRRSIYAIVCGAVSLSRAKKRQFGAKVLPPPQHASTNESTFVGEPVLPTEIDLKEVHFPSKVKKFGSNPSTSNLIRKKIV